MRHRCWQLNSNVPELFKVGRLKIVLRCRELVHVLDLRVAHGEALNFRDYLLHYTYNETAK